MDQYSVTTQALRARVEQLAQQISQRSQASAANIEPFFLDDIVNAVENVAGDVANAVGDAVNDAVNATHDVVNAVVNVAHDVANIAEDAIHATEAAVKAVTDHTDVITDVAHVTLEVVNVTPDVADFIGFSASVEAKDKATASAQAQARASAKQLIQARRALLSEKNNALVARTTAKRNEIKDKIATIRDSFSSLTRRRSSS